MNQYAQAFMKAKRHARDEFPRESCGIIVQSADGFEYVPSVNTPRKHS